METESVEVLRERLERYIRILGHTGNFLGRYPYWNLGKETFPLYERMNEAWRTLTPEDLRYNETVVRKNGENL